MTPDLTTRALVADLNARFAWALDPHDRDTPADVLAVDVHRVGGEPVVAEEPAA